MSNQYKHYSFDLWNTLIKYDSRFGVKKASYFYEKLNPSSLTYTTVENVIRDVNVMTNECNMVTGWNTEPLAMYYNVLHNLGYPKHLITFELLVDIYEKVEKMIRMYPPVIYDEHTLEVLNILKANKSTISITSNTGFIKGGTLRPILKKLGIQDVIDFDIYSDEIGYSKPNFRIFEAMWNTLRKINPVERHEVIHIGDNSTADGNGAANFGINWLIINSNSLNISAVI